jgi:hypothetical protein
LATLLWGSHFDAQAPQNLRQALFRPRRVLGQDVPLSDDEDVSLTPDDIACDATQLEVLLGQGTRTALTEAVELDVEPDANTQALVRSLRQPNLAPSDPVPRGDAPTRAPPEYPPLPTGL